MSIIPVDKRKNNIVSAIHSISWKESHRALCAPDFIEKQTQERQQEYLKNKINCGTKVYMMIDEKPVGIVSVTGSLIEEL